MNMDTLIRFLDKLAADPRMQREFAEFAARHGVDLSAGELSDADLAGVAGGARREMAQAAFETLDQKSSQLYNLLSQVVRTMNEERRGGGGLGL